MLSMTNLVLRGMLVHMLLFSGRCSFIWHVTTVKQFRAESRSSLGPSLVGVTYLD